MPGRVCAPRSPGKCGGTRNRRRTPPKSSVGANALQQTQIMTAGSATVHEQVVAGLLTQRTQVYRGRGNRTPCPRRGMEFDAVQMRRQKKECTDEKKR